MLSSCWQDCLNLGWLGACAHFAHSFPILIVLPAYSWIRYFCDLSPEADGT